MTGPPPTDQDLMCTLAADLPVALWVARASGEVVHANAMFRELVGVTADHAVTASAVAAPYRMCTRAGAPYPPERLPFPRALAERQLVVVDDLTIHRGDGARIHVRAFARPALDGAGAVTHVVVALCDITREVAAERARAASDERAQRAQRMEAIGTLAGGVAHDFNNLILGIKLLASQLAIDEDRPDRRRALAMIDEVTERASALSRSLLGFARRGKHRAAPVELNAVIDAMVEMLRRTLGDLAIETDLAPGHPTVVGDRSQLEQVIMNLVVNARDALADAGGHGRVVIRTAARGPVVVLEVADNGPGIPSELRDRVFEPYFTTKDHGPGGGTGLGLATVFGIVEAHGGRIEVRDGLGGRGASLWIELPAGPHRDETTTVRIPAPTRSAPGHGSILVIDDDAMVRRALQLSLASLGYDVITADGGAAGLEVVASPAHRLRGVLLDMVMPKMGGRATYLALRELAPALPVILISGYAMNEEVQAILDLGVRGFLQKPCSIEALAAALDDCLALG